MRFRKRVFLYLVMWRWWGDATKNGRIINPSLASLKIDRTAIVSTFFEQIEVLKKGEKPDPVVLKAEFIPCESLS